jgi:hypothetical protein
MPEAFEATEKLDKIQPTEKFALGEDSFGSLSDVKALFGKSDNAAAAAVQEHFGDLQLVDDSGSDVTVGKGRASFAPKNEGAANKEAREPRVLEESGKSGEVQDFTNVQRAANVSTDLDEDGQVRRATVTDEDGLRVRELEIPKGNTPLDEAEDDIGPPPDRFVEENKQLPNPIILNRENSSFETDEDGELKRAIFVQDDGRVSLEVEA